ncbi:hypothetical protein [Streptomyces sp. NBC_01618]|uniref:hypothetical protein n=1 Tax=Streptomyces sp. NBC_01618 TaxID=2975900 RepID=UPI0038664398|nr:hypothetical protein OH735_15380 [Streptomyces sp. NBC_01618]
MSDPLTLGRVLLQLAGLGVPVADLLLQTLIDLSAGAVDEREEAFTSQSEVFRYSFPDRPVQRSRASAVTQPLLVQQDLYGLGLQCRRGPIAKTGGRTRVAGRTVRQQLGEREGSVNSSPVAIQGVLLEGDEELRLVARISGVDRDGALPSRWLWRRSVSFNTASKTDAPVR